MPPGNDPVLPSLDRFIDKYKMLVIYFSKHRCLFNELKKAIQGSFFAEILKSLKYIMSSAVWY